MGWKQRFEENPTVFVLSVIVLTVAATFGTLQGLHSHLKIESISSAELSRLKAEGERASVELKDCSGRLAGAVEKEKTAAANIAMDMERRIEQERRRWLDSEKELRGVIEEKEKKIASLEERLASQALLPRTNKIESERPAPIVAPPPQLPNPYFINEILRVDVVSMSYVGAHYKLLLKHTNRTAQPLKIRAQDHSADTLLMDNKDRQYRYVPTYAVGDRTSLAISDRGDTVELAPGGTKIITFYFEAPSSGRNGLFVFSAKYGYGFGNNLAHSIMYVAIKEIPVAQETPAGQGSGTGN